MSAEKEWNLRPFQLEALKILREFQRICEKYSLTYYSDGGTSLGAVRHNGFIPWDDDLDVCMPREDFDRLLKVVDDELPPGMRFCRGGEEAHAPIYFSKIIMSEEGIIERMSTATGLSFDFAPFLDIFTLDGLPESVLDIKRWWIGRRMIRLCQLFRYPRSAIASKMGWFKLLVSRCLGCLLSPFYPKTKSNKEMMGVLDAYAKKWPYANSIMVVETAFFGLRTKRIFSKDMYGEPRVVPFEDGEIQVPQRVEEFLIRSYGDYMKLPPAEHRVPEHLMKRSYNHI